jgi:hypothetical protein
MFLSLSIVNVVMIFLLGATLCAVMTWITPVCSKSKAIVQQIDDGEGLAMRPTDGLKSPVVARRAATGSTGERIQSRLSQEREPLP